MIPSALLSPALGAGVLAVAGAAFWAWLVLLHDPAIRAEYQAKLDAQVAAARIEDQRLALARMAEVEEEHRQQLAAAATIRERIIRVPVTTACVASPAVAAALDGLRGSAGGHGAPGGAPAAPGVPGSTLAPAANRR